MRRDLTTAHNSFKQSLKLSVANIGLSQLNWKTVSQLGACSGKTSITEMAVGPYDVTRPRVGRTQPTSSLITDELTLGGFVVHCRRGPL